MDRDTHGDMKMDQKKDRNHAGSRKNLQKNPQKEAPPSPPTDNDSPRAILWEAVSDLDDLLRYGYRREEGRQVPPPDQPSSPDSLRTIQQEVADCRRCALHEGRTHTVPGTGDLEDVQVMVVGEAPGMEEDRQGLPFVGAAGEYLDKWLCRHRAGPQQGSVHYQHGQMPSPGES